MENDWSETTLGYDPVTGFRYAAVLLLGLTAFSTLSYFTLGVVRGHDWTMIDCLFMVVITLSTIGYGDWLGMRHDPVALSFTMALVVVGVAVHAFVVSNITALLFEGLFTKILRRKRMDRKIAKLESHIIICGAGATGSHCLEELTKTKIPFVAIDRNAELLESLHHLYPEMLYIVGEADEDDVLRDAGAERAKGLLACLDDDKLNLFVTLSARQLNPKLRIVSKVVDEYAVRKLYAAGADDVISPSAIGGLRMVSAMIRPTVITFLDQMMRDPTQAYRFEELHVEARSPVDGCTIAEADLRRHGDVLVVAAREPGAQSYIYSPSASFRLQAGTTLVALGRTEDLGKLRPQFNALETTMIPMSRAQPPGEGGV